MACYFLLIEEELRIRPTHGFIVLGDGTRHRIENEESLRAWVIELAAQIRAARKAVTVPIAVNPSAGQCPAVASGGIAGRQGFSGGIQERSGWLVGMMVSVTSAMKELAMSWLIPGFKTKSLLKKIV